MDLEEPYMIPDSQISGRSICRMCLLLMRTRDMVYTHDMLNKTFTISRASSEFLAITQEKVEF